MANSSIDRHSCIRQHQHRRYPLSFLSTFKQHGPSENWAVFDESICIHYTQTSTEPPTHTHSLSLPPSASSLKKKKRVGVDGGCKKKLLICEVGSYWLTLGLSKICLGFMAKHRVSACPFLCALMLGCAGKDVCCWARKMSDNSSGQVMTWARFYQVTIPPVLRTVYIYLHINYSLLLSNVSSNFCCTYTHPKTKRLSWPWDKIHITIIKQWNVLVMSILQTSFLSLENLCLQIST